MGLMVEATGLECNMGDICRIQLSEERYALAEVVGILEDTVQLMPYQELDGIGSGSVVINTCLLYTSSLCHFPSSAQFTDAFT